MHQSFQSKKANVRRVVAVRRNVLRHALHDKVPMPATSRCQAAREERLCLARRAIVPRAIAIEPGRGCHTRQAERAENNGPLAGERRAWKPTTARHFGHSPSWGVAPVSNAYGFQQAAAQTLPMHA